LHCHTIWQAPDAKLDSFADASNQFTFAPGEGLPGRVWQNVLPVWIPDIAAETNFPRAPFAAKENICTAFAFPILSGTRCLGVMEFFSREKREPDDALFGTVHSIGSQIGQFFERRRAEDAVRESEAQLRLARDQLASANTVLDQRVRERTAELTAANAALEEEIRARAQAERARLRLAAIVESSSDAIASRSLDGKITSWNRAAERTFGWTADEILGQPCATVIPEDHADEVEEAVQRVTNGEMVEPFETVALRKDGRAVPVSLTLSPVRDDEEIVSGISAIIRDISERKELQAEVLRVAEREQRRIAQDLHDGLGQHLAGISCLTNALKKDLAGNSSPDAKTASRISSLLDSAVSQTRNLARGLLPVSTEPNGLMLALGQLAQHLTGLFKVRCHFDCPDPVEVTDSTIAANFYRIAQEAATNSIKHGKARDIAIGLSASPERTVLAITDDGQGIKKTSSRSKGLGLRIMRHRAGVIGGSLIIQKRQGGGTEVICAVEKKGLNGNGTA
jgi:PAS domain S-box-containing protein